MCNLPTAQIDMHARVSLLDLPGPRSLANGAHSSQSDREFSMLDDSYEQGNRRAK